VQTGMFILFEDADGVSGPREDQARGGARGSAAGDQYVIGLSHVLRLLP
jgi:hypothetical protein